MLGIRAVCLWPGLPGAWLRGKVQQLLLALAATWILSFLLLATFVWPAWIGIGSLRALWGAAAIGWLGLAIRGHWQCASLQPVSTPEQAVAFTEAQGEYLRGNWFAAEARLLAILQADARDVETLLLLISVLRQTRRWQPALRRLQQLELLDGAQRWRHEIAREKEFMARALVAASEAEVTDEVTESATESAATETAIEPSAAQATASGDLELCTLEHTVTRTSEPVDSEDLLADALSPADTWRGEEQAPRN